MRRQVISVYVAATDPLSSAGVSAQLRNRPDCQLVDDAHIDSAQVAVVVADVLDEAGARMIRAVQRNDCPRVVLVTGDMDDAALHTAIECGVAGIVKRDAATPEQLMSAITSASEGEGVLPPDLLGRLMGQVGVLQRTVLGPQGLTLSGLSERELEVLRLVGDGFDTTEIASRLCYSERTVKNVIHDVTTRFGLRNRSHAVAFAARQGLI